MGVYIFNVSAVWSICDILQNFRQFGDWLVYLLLAKFKKMDNYICGMIICGGAVESWWVHRSEGGGLMSGND